MEINSLVKILEDKLKKNFEISNLKIEDKSFLHKRHQGFKDDKFHIKLTIESSELKKKSKLESNRKIYKLLNDEMNTSIHSLQIVII